jgi:hypothetical protein
MVKFTKERLRLPPSAGLSRCARAATGREHIAACARQPFFQRPGLFVGTLPLDAGRARRCA